MQIIGIAGKKRVGKDTVAGYITNYLEKRYNKLVLKIGFADPIREIGYIFGWNWTQMFDKKDNIHEHWGISWRTFVQQVGTDLFRNTWRTDAWIKLMEIRLKDADSNFLDYLIISDVRFNNEAELIKNFNSNKASLPNVIIKIDRDTGLVDNHESERGISKWDYNLYNIGSLEALKLQCELFADTLIPPMEK